MPFTDIVESLMVVACFQKKGAQTTESILDSTHEGCIGAASMHSHFPDNKEGWSGMLAHQHSADLTRTGLP